MGVNSSKNSSLKNKNIANKLVRTLLKKKYPYECKKISRKSHTRLMLNHLNNKNISNMLYGKTKTAKRIKKININNLKNIYN